MSRFYQASSGSDTESESEPEIAQKTSKYKYSDSDEESVKQVQERSKKSEEIIQFVKLLKNAKNIKDIGKCSEIFEDLMSAYEKNKKTIDKDSQYKQFIRCLADFEKFINDLWNDATWKNSTSAQNRNTLKGLRQGTKKYTKAFEAVIKECNEHPENYPEEEEVLSAASESEEEVKKKPVKKTEEESEEEESEEEDEDEEDWSSSTESDESDDSELVGDDLWKKFLKKPGEEEKTTTKEDTRDKPRKLTRVKTRELKREEEPEESESGVVKEKAKLFAKEEEINHKSVVDKLNEITSGRGRKGTDRREQLDLLIELKDIVKKYKLGEPIEVKILFAQIAINFDYNPRLSKCMKTENWSKCLDLVDELLAILKRRSDILVGENITDESESVITEPFRIRGCPLIVVDRMYDEYIKILQQCDAHGTEYVDRLKDEPKVCAIIDTLQAYLESKGNSQELCRIYLKKIENLYYKYDEDNKNNSGDIMDKLCRYIYSLDNTDRIRTKAMLCHIYHHALHDRWYAARDLILMSHLQESIDHSDIPLQILYNRTMVQVGLCAFRVGNIRESHAALLDIQIGNRAKELLAQGMMTQKNVEKTKEQEIKERQRLIPFHMHINLELLECMYLVSAMLIEIPYMSSRDYETKKRLISKQFHYQLKVSERQPAVGPPENMREHVVAASRAMKNGDWRACLNYLINEKMNAKVWNLIPKSQNVKTMLTEKVKEETMRTYLFKYSSVYESLSIANLADMFELPKTQVYSAISKMIINEELMASLDEPTETIILHRTEPTKLQTLALQLSEKINTLMEHTERIMSLKGGEIGPMTGRQQQQSQQNQQTNYYKQQGHWNKGNKNMGRSQKPGQKSTKKPYHQQQYHQQQQQQQQKQ